MRVICDDTNNPADQIALGYLRADVIPESLRDLAALVAAKVRELADDPTVIDVRPDPEGRRS